MTTGAVRDGQQHETRERAAIDVSRALSLVSDVKRNLAADPARALARLEDLETLFRPAAPSARSFPVVPPHIGEVNWSARGGLAAWQVRRVSDHVEAFLATTIITQDLANICRLSTGHFCRAFKASFGETPHAYIIRQRVRRAQMMMLGSDETLSGIANACGLADQAHLTRLFKRVAGTTPLHWRRSWQEDRGPVAPSAAGAAGEERPLASAQRASTP